MKTEDICVIRWLKPGVYIMNFYRSKYVTYKKTESGRHTWCPRDRGHALQGGPPLSWGPHVPFRLLLSSKILKYSKIDKNCHWSCFGVGLLTVPRTYSFSESEMFRKVSLMYSSAVTILIILVSTFMELPEI